MALTNYVGQSVWGMVLFYGIGFGLGAGIGLTGTESIAFYVFLVQMAFSVLWLSYFRFGPLEWGLADADLWEVVKNKEIK